MCCTQRAGSWSPTRCRDGDQDGPRRELRLGPDRAGNLLETVVLLLDDGDELVIHAMRMRPKYRGLLP